MGEREKRQKKRGKEEEQGSKKIKNKQCRKKVWVRASERDLYDSCNSKSKIISNLKSIKKILLV